MSTIRVIVTPIDADSARYAISILNDTHDNFSNGILDHGFLLHPRMFGLDDTHMPDDIWVQEPLHFGTLAAGARVTFEVPGGGMPERYDQAREMSARLTVLRIKKGDQQPGPRENLLVAVLMDWAKSPTKGRAGPTWQKRGKKPKF